MLSLCRLCANSLDETEISKEISELVPKLTFCCGWKPSENEWQMPQKACGMCVDELQRSWSFAEKVRTAEKQLSKLTSEVILTDLTVPTSVIEEEDMQIENEELYIDTIGSEQVPNDNDSITLDKSIEQSDVESSNLNQISNNKYKKATRNASKKIEFTSNSSQAAQCSKNQHEYDNTGVNNISECITMHRESMGNTNEKIKLTEHTFLAVLNDEDCLKDGTITSNAVAMLEELFPDMKTMTWADCEFKCKICNRTFKSPQKFFAHNRSIHSKESNSMDLFCFYCDSKHQFEHTLNQHMAKEHYPHLKFRCYYCKDYYWDESKLMKHRNMHTDIGYECEQCDEVIWNRHYLSLHVARKHFNKKTHASVQRTCICDLCDKVFTNKSSIRSHMLRHIQKFDYVCDQCGWKFYTKAGLKKHMYTHTDERPIICEQCDKRFKTKTDLQIHLKRHLNYRAFECTQCQKKYKTNFALTVHMRSHNKVYPYNCSYCEKKYRYLNSFLVHKRTHTADKPYACKSCDYKSTNWPNLQKHSMRIHSVDLRIRKNL